MNPAALRALFANPPRSAAAIVGVSSALPLLAGLRYQGRDHTLVQLGFACAHRDSGRLVLDPALGGGGPVLEDPLAQVFYPTTWLLRPLGAELAASVFVCVHLALAAWGASRLARSLGSGRRGALVTGLAFALCGTTVDLILHGPFLCAAAWLPIGWAGARELLRDLDPRGALWLGASLAMLVLGGDPQSAIVLSLVAAVEWARVSLRSPRTARVRTLALTAAGVAGAALGGAQVAATLGLRAATARGAGVGLGEKWSLDALGALGLFTPLSLTADARGGASLAAAYHAVPLSTDLWNASPYLGALLVSGALAGIVVGVRRQVALIGLVAVALAMGARLGLLGVLTRVIPPLALFRYPEKYLTLASLCVVVAGVQVWCVAARSKALQRKLLAAVLAALGALLALASWGVTQRDAIERAASRVEVPPLDLGALPSLASTLTVSVAVASAVTLLGALLLATARSRWVPALIVADLALLASRVAPLDTPVRALPSPREAVVPAGGRLCHGVGPTRNPPALPGFTSGVQRGVAFNRAELRADIHQCSRWSVPNTYLPTAQYASMRLALSLLDPSSAGGVQVARALGCSHVLAPDAAHPSLRPLPSPRGMAGLFAIPDPLPEVLVARAPTQVRRLRETWRGLLHTTSSAEVARLIDDPLRRAPQALPDGASVVDASLRWHGMTEGTLSLHGRGGAVVMIRRPWWPGWQATQRGRPLRVLRAAGVQLAIVVPEARDGAVRLKYVPSGLRAGIALSLSGALALGATWAALRRRARRGMKRG